MEKVFLTERIHPKAVEFLSESFEVVQGTAVDEDTIIREAEGCRGMLVRSAKVTEKIMRELPDLKVVAKHGIGVDTIDVDAATKLGVQVVNAPFSNLNAVSEHAVALLMSLSKRMVQMDQLTRKGRFADRNVYKTLELKGSTVGIIGMGRIARMTAKKLSGFEVEMIASDPYVKQESVAELGVTMVSQDELLERSDFVILHTVLIPATHHMIGEQQFKKMKNSACIINVSRGPVIDEEAMIRALQAGEIAGAGLDVFEQEPPAEDNPLFAMDQVIVSPHNAALSEDALLAMAMDSALGVKETLLGENITYPVNKPEQKR